MTTSNLTRFMLVAAASLISAVACAQTTIPLPPSSGYTTLGQSHGFWFVVPASGLGFRITGLSVPGGPLVSGGSTFVPTEQHLLIRKYSTIPTGSVPTGASTAVFWNYPQNDPAGSVVPCDVDVNPGDVVLILGSLVLCTQSSPFSSCQITSQWSSTSQTTVNVLGNSLTLRGCYGGSLHTPSPSLSSSRIGMVTVHVRRKFRVVGTAESTANSGSLREVDGILEPGQNLRWNFQPGAFAGSFAVVGLNLGSGPQLQASTPEIPGLELYWAGSTPTGTAFLLPPNLIGGPDYTLAIPPALLSLRSTIRIQGIVLDPTVTGPLPVTPTDNTIEWTYLDPAVCESFESTTNGLGNYAPQWSDGGGTRMWTANSGSTPTTGTGPSAAASGTQYMYCEMSSTFVGDTWAMNSPVYSAANMPNGRLSFQLSRVGATTGTFEVRMGDGSGSFPTLLQAFTGPGVAEWDLVDLAIAGPAQATYQFQFHYTRVASSTGDLAIDDVCVN